MFVSRLIPPAEPQDTGYKGSSYAADSKKTNVRMRPAPQPSLDRSRLVAEVQVPRADLT